MNAAQLCANPTQCIIITTITSSTAVATRNSNPNPHTRTGDEYPCACGLIPCNITNLLIFTFTTTKKTPNAGSVKLKNDNSYALRTTNFVCVKLFQKSQEKCTV
jgi:hypothetical protein